MSKHSCLTSCTALPRGCYILSETDSFSMLPISDYAWTEQRIYITGCHHCYVYFKDISASLESMCYLGPYAWYIKKKRDKARKKHTKKKKKKKKNTITTNADSVCKITLDLLTEKCITVWTASQLCYAHVEFVQLICSNYSWKGFKYLTGHWCW